MLLDLHIHTSPRSPCARGGPADVCRTALARGLDAIAFTEHDQWWDPSALSALRTDFMAMVILGGVEVSCPEGHFLVFVPPGAEFPLPGGFDLPLLERTVHEREGVLAWAHPFRWDSHEPFWLGSVTLDAVEVASTNMMEEAAAQARDIARRQGITTLKNSDAHHHQDVGRHFNNWDTVIRDELDLIARLRR